MVDPGPLKALSDTEEDYESSPPTPVGSMDGEQFGTLFAIGVAVVIFLIFLVGACKG